MSKFWKAEHRVENKLDKDLAEFTRKYDESDDRPADGARQPSLDGYEAHPESSSRAGGRMPDGTDQPSFDNNGEKITRVQTLPALGTTSAPTTDEKHGKKKHKRAESLPVYNSNGHLVTPGIQPEGESGRAGFHPQHFFRIVFLSANRVSCAVNVLWPAVPIAIVVHFARPDWHLATFILNYIAMVPAANTIGFAGQELARKLPKVVGVVLETILGGIVEIVLFLVLIKQGSRQIQVIKAAILGSVLANLLLCLGLCFVAGGAKREEQEFHPAVSEVGSGLMLVAGMALVVPTIFVNALSQQGDFASETLSISRGTSIVLLIAFFIYMYFQLKTHHGLYDEILEFDELRDTDAEKERKRPHLTLFESIIALIISIACVSMIALFLVEEIEYIVEERGVKDAFVGLILVPLVEKAAEHLTAVDEAYDDQMNFALSHVLGASVQTVLFNTPLVVIVGWGLDINMDLNFAIFDAMVLILAILVVGSFLRDGKSNYLEGALCVLTYIIIAICAFFYPNPAHAEGAATGEGAGEAVASLARALSG